MNGVLGDVVKNNILLLFKLAIVTSSDYGNKSMKAGFGEERHRKLAKDFRRLNCKSLMVIGKTPLTEELYGDLVVAEYEKSYAVNIFVTTIEYLSIFQ